MLIAFIFYVCTFCTIVEHPQKTLFRKRDINESKMLKVGKISDWDFCFYLTVLNIQGSDLGCSVCLLELPVCLAQGVIWERAEKVSSVASLTNHKCFWIYVSALPGGDETMLHSVHIVIIWRMAISDIPVSICWHIQWRSYPTTVIWRILGRLYPTAADVVSRGIPHSESINTLHFRDLTLFEGSLIKIYFISCLAF